jgi:glycine/D-amino acid oxidase-like deaminating enzyme/nitrite reductase/ring-hydroxylating ferredoxin subunit
MQGTRSLWQEAILDSVQPTEAEPDSNFVPDALIVGAGIAGLTIAYELLGRGLTVAVIDKEPKLGRGMTGRTTAHLTSALDDRFTALARHRSDAVARLAYDAHQAAIERITEIARSESIDCDLHRVEGYLIAAGEDGPKVVDDELATTQRLGFGQVERCKSPIAGWGSGPALRFGAQGRFHAGKYLAGLARAVVARGAHLWLGHQVVELGAADNPVWVETASGTRLRARNLVIATNAPIHERFKLQTKVAPYRTYAVALRIPAGVIGDALYWDTCDPYRYVRLQEDGDGGFWLIAGGADHKTGQVRDERESLDAIEHWARSVFVQAGETGPRWSGQVLETIDGLAFIGKNPGDEKLWVAVGDSGMGMTHGTISGMLLADLITGRQNRWAEAFDPARKPVGAAGEWIRENLNVAAQLATDWLGGSDVETMDKIPAGEGAVLRHNASKIAVYRDHRGKLHVRSAVCPHLGCIVQWNRLEKGWDCPCHGSLFDPTGRVLNGPSRAPLATVEDFAGADGNPNTQEMKRAAE